MIPFNLAVFPFNVIFISIMLVGKHCRNQLNGNKQAINDNNEQLQGSKGMAHNHTNSQSSSQPYIINSQQLISS